MVYAQGEFFGGEVISEHQVQLELVPHLAGDGRDGIVRFPVRLRENERGLVAVPPPGRQHLVSQLHQPVGIPAPQAQHGHGPEHDSRLHVLKTFQGKILLNGRFGHGKGVMSALEMVVAQNGAAHNGQIRVGAQEIVGEQPDEIEQLHKRGPLDLHGNVLPVEHDAVLVIIHIGGILESPLPAVDGDGDHPVVVPGRVVGSARVTHVLHAQLAFGVTALLGQLGRGDGLGILLRFGKVHRDVQPAVTGVSRPLHVLFDAVAAYVVRVLAQLVVILRGGLRRLPVAFPEFPVHLRGSGHQAVHQPGVEQVPVHHAVALQQAPGAGVVQKFLQDLLQAGVSLGRFRLPVL